MPNTQPPVSQSPPPKKVDAVGDAWGIIANVGGGDWSAQSPEWQEAAARWRDTHLVVPPLVPPPLVGGPEFGRVFGEVMLEHPKADARLVNDILRTVARLTAAAPPTQRTLTEAGARHQGVIESSRWSRGGWHSIKCWRWWAADPENRACACDDIRERQRRAAAVDACLEHDTDGPADEPSGYPTCSKCGAILTAAAPPTGEPR